MTTETVRGAGRPTHRRGARFRLLLLAILLVLVIGAVRLLPLAPVFQKFERWMAALGAFAGVVYGIVYVLATLALVPGLMLTLGAGFLFGLGGGSLVVSLASTTAAALAFLIARSAGRERLTRFTRGKERFEAIDRAIGAGGWRMVVLLRLSPLVPFSISNYLYGLTPIRFWPYVAASWASMLPATVLYVSLGAAGRSLAAGKQKSPAEWVLLAAGIVATAAVTVLLARAARRELERTRRSSAAPAIPPSAD